MTKKEYHNIDKKQKPTCQTDLKSSHTPSYHRTIFHLPLYSGFCITRMDNALHTQNFPRDFPPDFLLTATFQPFSIY